MSVPRDVVVVVVIDVDVVDVVVDVGVDAAALGAAADVGVTSNSSSSSKSSSTSGAFVDRRAPPAPLANASDDVTDGVDADDASIVSRRVGTYCAPCSHSRSHHCVASNSSTAATSSAFSASSGCSPSANSRSRWPRRSSLLPRTYSVARAVKFYRHDDDTTK